MKKANDEVLAGKVPFRPRERCWPYGVPNFDVIALVEPYFIYQTPDKVVMISQGGPEIRYIYLNVSHSKNVEPSWYGESIGRYEGGDTLVVDTIGISTKSFIDSYRTPHTDQLHVLERFKLAADDSGHLDLCRGSRRLYDVVVSGASLASARDYPVLDGVMQRKQRRLLQSRTGACARGRRAGFLIARFPFDAPAFSRSTGRQAERTGGVRSMPVANRQIARSHQ
jgi:hypothetical protein